MQPNMAKKLNKTYILIKNESDETAIVPENETFKALDGVKCIWVKKSEFEKKGNKTFLYDDEAYDFYKTANPFATDDIIPEPKKGEYICVYSMDGEGVGEDPYYWDYPYTCYRWWNGSNYDEIVGEDIEELELIDTFTKYEPNYNYGRAEYFYIFKNESDEYIIGYENEGYAIPICEDRRFDTEEEAKTYIKNPYTKDYCQVPDVNTDSSKDTDKNKSTRKNR